MAQTGTHSFVAAHIVRVGDTTTLIALPDWHHGQILVPVDTMLLIQVTRCSRADLPGMWLTVGARLDAVLDADLDLRGWRPWKEEAA